MIEGGTNVYVKIQYTNEFKQTKVCTAPFEWNETFTFPMRGVVPVRYSDPLHDVYNATRKSGGKQATNNICLVFL